MKKRSLAKLVAFGIALLLMFLLPSQVTAASEVAGSNGYVVAIKILGSDGIPIVGAVGSVILNIACYGCGTIDTVPVSTGVSDANGIINLQLPLGPYTMQIAKPGGGTYLEFNFNVPQTATMSIRLNVDSNTVRKALKDNPIDLKQFSVYNVTGAMGGQVDYAKWFLPNDDFAGLYSLELMKAMVGYQQTTPIYVLPYTSPPALLFGLALLLIALEPYAVKSARKDKARVESEESAS